MLIRIALGLEVGGFFLTGILVVAMQWEKLEPLSEWGKQRIMDSRKRLGNIAIPIVNVYMKAWTRVAPDRQLWKNEVSGWLVPFLFLRVLVAYPFIPIFLVLLSAMFLLLAIPGYTAQLLSGHKAVTNLLIGLGTIMIFAGLTIELYLSLN